MHEEQLAAACARILQTATRRNGIVVAYFRRQAEQEARLRSGFGRLVASLRTGAIDVIDLAETMLGQLDRDYNTGLARYCGEQAVPDVSRCIIETIGELGWPGRDQPSVLDSSPTDAERIANAVRRVLANMRDRGCRHEYSLSTKFLHFCFPDTVAIYDSQAARSIWMWSLFAFYDAADQMRLQQFDLDTTQNPTGGGYGGILEFYRSVWGSTSPDDHQRAEAAATRISDGLQLTVQATPVSVLGLLDKLLWFAKGNPISLGLACPLS